MQCPACRYRPDGPAIHCRGCGTRMVPLHCHACGDRLFGAELIHERNRQRGPLVLR